MVTMSGKYEDVAGTGALAGHNGSGTFSGYYTAEDKYHVDWKAHGSGDKAASN